MPVSGPATAGYLGCHRIVQGPCPAGMPLSSVEETRALQHRARAIPIQSGGQVRPSQLFTLTLGALALAGQTPAPASPVPSPAPAHPTTTGQ